MPISNKGIIVIKAIIHAVSVFFFALLVVAAFEGRFGADPVDGITHFTGLAALNTLIITLLVSPLARTLKQGALIRCRRVLGLYSFFWATLHMLTYFVLDLSLDFSLLFEEIVSRPYLTLGAICWVLLLALSVTSTASIQRKMGAKWQSLHNWVYLVLVLAPVHFYWSAKSEIIEPSLYMIAALSLLFVRWKKLKRLISRPIAKRSF